MQAATGWKHKWRIFCVREFASTKRRWSSGRPWAERNLCLDFFFAPIKKNMNVYPIISNFRVFQQENPNLKLWSVYFIYLRYNLFYTFSLAENTDVDSHKCMSGSILSNTSPPSQSFLSLPLSLLFSLSLSLLYLSLSSIMNVCR